MNEKSTKTVFRLFGAWNDEKEQRWLEKMAGQGWHLTKPGFFYRFGKADPADMAYRIDFPRTKRSELKEYLDLFKDAGWEYVGRFGRTYYFRARVVAGLVREIYTDKPSRIAKYRRLLFLLAALLWLTAFNVWNTSRHRSPAHDFFHDLNSAAGWVQLAVALFLGYAIIRILLKIGKVKRAPAGKGRG